MDSKFGEKVKKLRKDAGWSQDQLGEKIGIHGRHVGKYETGRALPGSETILKIAEVFNVSIDYLLRDDIDRQVGQHTPYVAGAYICSHDISTPCIKF